METLIVLLACSISTGISGPLSFGLGLRDSALIIIFFGLLTAVCVPYFSLWGPILGLRQMVHARYAFGYSLPQHTHPTPSPPSLRLPGSRPSLRKDPQTNLASLYGSVVPLLLNMATLTGYGIIGCILGGQTLSAISASDLSVTVGIVIIALLNLVVIFCGSGWIHQFDLFAWVPSLIAILGVLGTSGKHLYMQADAPPATARSVLSFGSLIGGFFLPWAAIASDFSTYFDPRSKRLVSRVPPPRTSHEC